MRIFREQVFAQQAAARQNVSKNGDPPCRSRKILQLPGPNILANFFEHGTQPTILSEIGVNLTVPFDILALANELSQLCEIGGREGFDGVFNFGEAHRPHFNRKRSCSQGTAAPRLFATPNPSFGGSVIGNGISVITFQFSVIGYWGSDNSDLYQWILSIECKPTFLLTNAATIM
jgi:hypothetical protein